jgi:dihydrofolate synthase/folylpolyglutamate synthase
VITPVSYDHTEVLGRTLEAIAAEKAGVLRPGRPVVLAPQVGEVETVVRAACDRAGALLVRIADRVRWVHREMNEGGQTLHVRGAHDYGEIHLALVGRHQALNAATAVAAAEELRGAGFPLPPEAVRRGLEGLRWPARVEVVGAHPLRVVDVAHNVASMQALRDALLEVWPGRRLILVFGMVASHDHEGPAAVIAPLADLVIATGTAHVHPLPPDTLAAAVRPYAPAVEVQEDRSAAVRRALSQAAPDDLVCVTGSFYLAGEVRPLLLPSQEVPSPGAKREEAPLVQERAGSSPQHRLLPG